MCVYVCLCLCVYVCLCSLVDKCLQPVLPQCGGHVISPRILTFLHTPLPPYHPLLLSFLPSNFISLPPNRFSLTRPPPHSTPHRFSFPLFLQIPSPRLPWSRSPSPPLLSPFSIFITFMLFTAPVFLDAPPPPHPTPLLPLLLADDH